MNKPTTRQNDATLRLGTPVHALHGVGSRRAEAFARLGIRTVGDLLRHLPMRYEQLAGESGIESMTAGTIGSTRGTIEATRWVPSFRGGGRNKGRFEATLFDGHQRLSLVWFNGRHMSEHIEPGVTVWVQGKIQKYEHYLQMVNPKWKRFSPAAQSTQTDASCDVDLSEARLQPIYPATEMLNSQAIEKVLHAALPMILPQVPEPLPTSWLEHHAMPTLAQAYRMAHQPRDAQEPITARRRLAYNELLLLQLGMSLKRAYVKTQLQAPALHLSEAIKKHILARFPFTLTGAQQRTLDELSIDLQETVPMNRLLQGDVGAGKTVVALFAMLAAAANRKQAALIAPTEILAEQHLASIKHILAGSQVRLALFTGNTIDAPNASTRTELLNTLSTGDVDLVIGTHALLSPEVQFNDLAVVVIDEQHRFGVHQRAAFRDEQQQRTSKKTDTGKRAVPHHLVMTATPIPRTLSLTLFGDLDVSILDELPPGRGKVTTRVVTPNQCEQVYGYVRERIATGEQAYIVVPAIEDDALSAKEGLPKLKSIASQMKTLANGAFKGLRIAAVHGRLARPERETIMQQFRDGELDVLIATTVIEVGVDVPNATIMIIEHAERFGLAQLHQLRGRIGRNTDGKASLCVLVSEPTTESAQQRMQAMAQTRDGFRIAEIDFEIRGMGEFIGTQQSGMPPFRVATIPEHLDLLQLARRDAQNIVEQDPTLTQPEHALLRKVLLNQYSEALGLVDIG